MISYFLLASFNLLSPLQTEVPTPKSISAYRQTGAHVAVVAVSDSTLTIELAKRVATVYAQIDSFTRAHPGAVERQGDTLQLTPEYANSWMHDEKVRIERIPELVALLKATDFTPATYAQAYVRIVSAWNMSKVQTMLVAQGVSPDQVRGLPTLPAGDLDFVSKHEGELKQLGLPEPPSPFIRPAAPSEM